MLARLLEVPLRSSMEHNNTKLEKVFSMIKSQLDVQVKDSLFIPDPN
jgi:hypothetical protein